jgi:hypothetical protein
MRGNRLRDKESFLLEDWLCRIWHFEVKSKIPPRGPTECTVSHATLHWAGALIVALILLVGCGSDSAPRQGEWLRDADTTGAMLVEVGPDVCLDCIELHPRVVLGDEEGPGFVEGTQFVVGDEMGRYWVLQQHGVKIFAPDGSFLRQVGQEGRGPGEFMGAFGMFLDNSGQIHVFDPENLRWTVLGQDFSVIQEHRIPAGVWDAAPLPDARRFVVNMNLTTPERLGLPLHILERPEPESANAPIIASFGERSDETRPFIFKRVAVDESGTIFAAPEDRYLVEVWSSDGAKVAGLERRGLWEAPPPHDAPNPSSPEPHLWAELTALHVDAAGRLWVNAWLPKEGWLEHTYETRDPDGVIRRRWDKPSDVYTGVIEVIDLETGAVTARAELGDTLPTRFITDQLIHGMEFTPDGVPQVVIFDIRTQGILSGR